LIRDAGGRAGGQEGSSRHPPAAACTPWQQFKWGVDELSAALRHNHLDVPQWLVANVPLEPDRSLPIKPTVKRGNFEMLQWVLTIHLLEEQTLLVEFALDTDRLEIVQWVIEHNYCDPDQSASIYLGGTAEKGEMSVLKWMAEQDIGYCSPECVASAGAKGQFEAVR
jgi:hypothetical protein